MAVKDPHSLRPPSRL